MPGKGDTITVQETREVPIEELSPYPGNPRNGDIEAIEGSLHEHGQYRAIVVQKSTMRVLAGNHTLHALHAQGAKRVLCHLLDVDDRQAAKIVLVDNRTNDLAKYDDAQLAELLQTLDGDLAGTAYEDRDLKKLLEKLDAGAEPDSAIWAQKWELVVECEGEQQQRELFDRLEGEGIKCRVLTL